MSRHARPVDYQDRCVVAVLATTGVAALLGPWALRLIDVLTA